jgi:ABC-type sugar transport system ATPase subunit
MATIELKHVYKEFSGHSSVIDYNRPEPAADPYPTAVERIKAGGAGPQRRPKVPFAIEDLNLTIPDGKVMVVLGPSGCGKSTLLHLIAGLKEPDSGEICYDGVNMEDVSPGERGIGMVFQNYALYPQYSSQRNILSYFSFRKKTPQLDRQAEEKYRRTSELMGVGMEYLLHKKPGRLSGGEQQRVAIARCITRDPALFLMDEPFSNLDAKLREKYRVHLKRLLREFHITTVYVTHDQHEALILADLIAIMNLGRIEQVGTPQDIYHRPNNMFVADFLFFNTDTPAINFLESELVAGLARGDIVGVRSEDIVLCEPHTAGAMQATVIHIRPNPIRDVMILTLDRAGTEIQMQVSFDVPIAVNDLVWFRFGKYHIFSKGSGRRIRSHMEEQH